MTRLRDEFGLSASARIQPARINISAFWIGRWRGRNATYASRVKVRLFEKKKNKTGKIKNRRERERELCERYIRRWARLDFYYARDIATNRLRRINATSLFASRPGFFPHHYDNCNSDHDVTHATLCSATCSYWLVSCHRGSLDDD